ncbi:TPA: hypothetical protein ACPVX8_001274 [Vibrio parahaemolyticus]
MATTSLQNAKTRLIELEGYTDSPVFTMSRKIVEFLERERNQDKLTVSGLRVALGEARKNENALIEAAFVLTVHPFEVLDVEYRLYNDTFTELLEVIDKREYAKALSEGEFYFEGELIAIDQFQSRVFPIFRNKFSDSYNVIAYDGVASKI